MHGEAERMLGRRPAIAFTLLWTLMQRRTAGEMHREIEGESARGRVNGYPSAAPAAPVRRALPLAADWKVFWAQSRCPPRWPYRSGGEVPRQHPPVGRRTLSTVQRGWHPIALAFIWNDQTSKCRRVATNDEDWERVAFEVVLRLHRADATKLDTDLPSRAGSARAITILGLG